MKTIFTLDRGNMWNVHKTSTLSVTEMAKKQKNMYVIKPLILVIKSMLAVHYELTVLQSVCEPSA